MCPSNSNYACKCIRLMFLFGFGFLSLFQRSMWTLRRQRLTNKCVNFIFFLLFLIQLYITWDDLTSSLVSVGVDHFFDTEHDIDAFTCCQAIDFRGNNASKSCELDGIIHIFTLFAASVVCFSIFIQQKWMASLRYHKTFHSLLNGTFSIQNDDNNNNAKQSKITVFHFERI